jgi:hypothetical protein
VFVAGSGTHQVITGSVNCCGAAATARERWGGGSLYDHVQFAKGFIVQPLLLMLLMPLLAVI